MKQRFVYLLKLLALVSLTAYLSSSGVLKAENGSKAIEITDKAGKSVVLYEQSYALIIWVRDYQHRSWNTLEAVPKGAKLLEDALRKRGFNVVVSQNPTSQELRDVVNKFIGEYGYAKNNRLVIFFAGHGWTIDETDGYIVPSDAPDPITDEPGFFNLAISMEEVMAWARRIRANHTLFIFDSCFSGTLFETKTRPNPNDAYVRTLTGKPVRQFLTAGDAGEEVPAGNDFVRLFIQGLDGEADSSKDGYVTGLEIGAFVQTRLPGLTRNAQSPQYGKIQNTRLRQGDIVFRSLTKPISSPLPNPSTLPTSSENTPTKSPDSSTSETSSSTQPTSSTEPILISKATGVDYTRLRDLLADERWKDADEETLRAMLQATGREKEGWFRDEDIDNFSCEDLGIIDKLWLESSQGKFGFSVQKDIYEELGGFDEVVLRGQMDGSSWDDFFASVEVQSNFGYRVGWKRGERETEDWKTLEELTFNLNAPSAHLPSWRGTDGKPLGVGGLFSGKSVVGYPNRARWHLFSRAKNCNL